MVRHLHTATKDANLRSERVLSRRANKLSARAVLAAQHLPATSHALEVHLVIVVAR